MDRRYGHRRKRTRSRSRSPEYQRYRSNKPRRRSFSPETPTADFTFERFKHQLNKILSYSDYSLPSTEDLWIFVRKYEATLKKAGKSILQKKPSNSDVQCTSTGAPIEFSKDHCVNFTNRKIKFIDTAHEVKLDENVFRQFLDIVSVYMDFKNKEKFSKLKKLRQQQRDLPVAQYREEIASAVQHERVVIVAGDTGCGKSTQVPQYLREAGYSNIACTQPRRIACISLAKRVAFESLSQFGTEVGYQIRFEKSKSSHTKICFITEGLLLRQMSSDSLPAYDVIILDEVHERHLHGDFLLGVLKCLIQTRTDLKLVLMSATINIHLFVDYFANEKPAVVQVPGRLYPIELHYKPIFIEGKPSRDDRLDPQPYVQIMQLVDTKYPKDERGDLLIFLSGVKEITAICTAAQKYADKTKAWIVLPLHSGLSLAEQDKVFDYPPEGVRKCIISTNIAETSVTIDGIRFVVDSGKVKEMSYDASCKMQRLKEFWISKASAEQRKGRAGRTGPGVCYRIYSEQQYGELEEFSSPEVARVPLASLLLLMCSLGMSDVRRFPFLDAPPPESIENAILELKQHGALSTNEKLTLLGRSLSNLPVEVPLAKALVIGSATLPRHKGDSILALAAVLGVRNVFTMKASRDLDAENARKPEESDHGDPLSLLSLYCAWLRVKAEHRSDSRGWCRRRQIEEQRFYEVTALAAQFKGLLQDNNLLEVVEEKELSSAQKAIRHGQLKQLKDMRRQHKMQAVEDSKKKKRLKVDSWELVDESVQEKSDNTIDIKDIEFRMTNDAARIQDLICGTSASSGRDLVTLKLVLCRALYPQIAMADEFNHCKSVSEQLFHTSSKAFVFLHPTSYFGRSAQILQLTESDVVTPPLGYTARLQLSAKHQLLCYLSLLETVKPYITSSMRMPAAQTLLLLAHSIDTDAALSRMVFDSWVLLEFPHPHSGATVLQRALLLRSKWDHLVESRLRDANPNKSLENELDKAKHSNKSLRQLQHELSCELTEFMNCEVYYTMKRLLPADLKVMYSPPDAAEPHPDVEPNPFCDGFKCYPHERKGGVYVSDNVVYNCLVNTEWSYKHFQEVTSEPYSCPQCGLCVCLSPLEVLQHKQFTCSNKTTQDDGPSTSAVALKPNSTKYCCDVCKCTLHLTPVEILKHKKSCKLK